MKIVYVSIALTLISFCIAIENTPFVMFDTGSPPSPFGLDGFDIFESQSIAMKFVANIDAKLSSIGVWMMSNGADKNNTQILTVSLIEGNTTHPLGKNLFSCNISVPGFGWDPHFLSCNATKDVTIDAFQTYWVA